MINRTERTKMYLFLLELCDYNEIKQGNKKTSQNIKSYLGKKSISHKIMIKNSYIMKRLKNETGFLVLRKFTVRNWSYEKFGLKMMEIISLKKTSQNYENTNL